MKTGWTEMQMRSFKNTTFNESQIRDLRSNAAEFFGEIVRETSFGFFLGLAVTYSPTP